MHGERPERPPEPLQVLRADALVGPTIEVGNALCKMMV